MDINAFYRLLQFFDIAVTERGLSMLFQGADFQNRKVVGGDDLWRLAFVETLEKPGGHGEGKGDWGGDVRWWCVITGDMCG